MNNIKKIKSMDNISDVCIYDIDNLTCNEEADDIREMDKSIGFYVKVGHQVIGVMESLRGPIFFNNERLYYLKEIEYCFSHRRLAEKRGNFQLIVNDEIKEDIIYDIPIYTDYDPWSAEEDVDFFQWLIKSTDGEEEIRRFYDFYTSK